MCSSGLGVQLHGDDIDNINQQDGELCNAQRCLARWLAGVVHTLIHYLCTCTKTFFCTQQT